MPPTVGKFCQALAQSRLLTSEELDQVSRQLRAGRMDGEALEHLPAWLVTLHYLTPYQAQRLLEGHPDHFYLGRYKLLERLGRGTMARVFKAVCPNGELFAVKVLTTSRAHDPRWRSLFDREACEAVRYRHPHIARTFEAGRADGLHYLVMEYLDGETLADVLRRPRRLPPAEAVRVAYQALRGLEHLHEQGAVHCNLEPAHLMLVPAPAPGQPDTTLEATVKILDAGLGRPLFSAQLQDVGEQVAEHGEAALHGQVDYIAPELVGHSLPATAPPSDRGAAGMKGADIRADVYSVGCVLYHCVAGQPPFPGGSVLDRVIRHATESAHPLNAINPEVSEGLQLVVERMMARDPDQRYPDPAAAARALLAFLPPEKASSAPVPLALPVDTPVARPAPVENRQASPPVVPRTRRRRRALLAMAGLGLLLLAAVLVLRRGHTPPNEVSNPSDAVARTTPPPADNPRTVSPSPAPAPEERAPKPEPEPKVIKEPPKKDPVREPPEPNKTPQEEKKPAATPPPDSRPTRLPEPLEKDQARAEALIRQVFRDEYARPSPADRRALAQKLLRQGIETRDDTAARFVLLREARDLAAQSGDVDLALRALEEMGRGYFVGEVASKVRIFEQAAKGARSPATCKTLVERILETLPQAIARDDHESAIQLIALAEPLAGRAMNRPLQRKVAVAGQSLVETWQELERLHAEGINPRRIDPREGVPADAETCLRLGKFFCFLKGDWSRGLPLLAGGSDERLRELARADLFLTTEAATQVRRGDSWWALAEAHQKTPRLQLQRRAVYWYQQALPGLSGLTRTRVEQRIKLAAES